MCIYCIITLHRPIILETCRWTIVGFHRMLLELVQSFCDHVRYSGVCRRNTTKRYTLDNRWSPCFYRATPRQVAPLFVFILTIRLALLYKSSHSYSVGMEG